jgi:hypothetical protein
MIPLVIARFKFHNDILWQAATVGAIVFSPQTEFYAQNKTNSVAFSPRWNPNGGQSVF